MLVDYVMIRARRLQPSIVLSLVLAATGADVAAQQLPSELFPPPGTEVRILFRTDAGIERVSGRLAAVSADELVLGLEASAGRNHLLGAGKGLLFGTLGGALLVGTFGALLAAGDQEPRGV